MAGVGLIDHQVDVVDGLAQGAGGMPGTAVDGGAPLALAVALDQDAAEPPSEAARSRTEASVPKALRRVLSASSGRSGVARM